MIADYDIYVQTNYALPMSKRFGGVLEGARRQQIGENNHGL